MSVLLQIGFPSGEEFFGGGVGQMIRNSMSETKELLWFLLISFILFLSLTEPLKVLIRRNIGGKALKFKRLLAGTSFYMTWAIAWGWISLGSIYAYFNTDYLEPNVGLILLSLYGLAGAITVGWAAIRILKRGMDEHYQAKTVNSRNWEELEFRGQNFYLVTGKGRYAEHFQRILHQRSQAYLWYNAEPIFCVKVSLILLLNPVIGIPALATSLAFWFNEWYIVYHKPRKIREAYLNMKIEMEKATTYYNESNLADKPHIVTTE